MRVFCDGERESERLLTVIRGEGRVTMGREREDEKRKKRGRKDLRI